MRRRLLLTVILTAPLALSLFASSGGSAPLGPDAKLPEAVERTFRAAFPKAEIARVDAEEESGVMVYDFEFTEGKLEKETDITADGTLLESTLVVVPDVVPAAAMKSIRAAARGGKLGRLERIEIGYELENGNAVRLPALVTHYACELSRAGKRAEVFVDGKGAVIEAPKWVSEKQWGAKAPPKGTP